MPPYEIFLRNKQSSATSDTNYLQRKNFSFVTLSLLLTNTLGDFKLDLEKCTVF